MNCERIQELYTDIFEKAVSGTLLDAVEHHFKVCTDCRTDYAKFEMAMQLLTDVELPQVEAPASFRAEILAKIEAQPRKVSAAAGLWSTILAALSPGEQRLRYQVVTGFAIVAIAATALLYPRPASTPNVAPACLVGPCVATPAQPQYAGMFRDISTEVRSDGRTYHDFTLHLPTAVTDGAVDAYVIDDEKPLLDDSLLSDDSSVTPVWSGAKTLDAGHSLNVPVAVVSDVPAGSTLNFMVRETTAGGGEQHEAAFVPVNNASGAWTSITVPAGTDLFDTLQTIAAAGSMPIVLDNSVISMVNPNGSGTELSTFQSAAMLGGEPSEQSALTDALKSSTNLAVVNTGSQTDPVLAVVAKPS